MNLELNIIIDEKGNLDVKYWWNLDLMMSMIWWLELVKDRLKFLVSEKSVWRQEAILEYLEARKKIENRLQAIAKSEWQVFIINKDLLNNL